MSLSSSQATRYLSAVMLACLLILPTSTARKSNAQPQPASRLFPQTGKTVQGRFLEYWEAHGGVVQQGYPISAELLERSATDGKVYKVQYFERAVFEYHPEMEPPHDVLGSLLGVFRYRARYPGGASGQVPNNGQGSVFFPETGKRLGEPFLGYWQSHGGLAQSGYPISDEFLERSDLDGNAYTVQYFERAVLEYHPEHAGTPHEVLLSHLGRSRFQDMYIAMLPAVRPSLSDAQQRSPQLSDSYLVWQENTPPNPNEQYSEIFALDLENNRHIHVTAGRAGSKFEPRVSGSIVVWNEYNTCPQCEHDVIAEDLSTGQTFTVATGPANQLVAGISGRTVLWTDSLSTQDPNGKRQYSFRLLMKQVGSERVEEVPIRRGATDAQISEEYVVWSEAVDCSTGVFTPLQHCVFALNRATRSVRGVATRKYDTFQVPTLEYVLSDHRVLVMESLADSFDHTQHCPCRYYIVDLDSGRRTELPDLGSSHIPSASMQGNTIVWAKSVYLSDKRITETDIWGLDLTEINLKEPKLLPLVRGKRNQQHPAVWGDWLAWENSQISYDERLGLMPLSSLIATAQDREKALSPSR